MPPRGLGTEPCGRHCCTPDRARACVSRQDPRPHLWHRRRGAGRLALAGCSLRATGGRAQGLGQVCPLAASWGARMQRALGLGRAGARGSPSVPLPAPPPPPRLPGLAGQPLLRLGAGARGPGREAARSRLPPAEGKNRRKSCPGRGRGAGRGSCSPALTAPRGERGLFSPSPPSRAPVPPPGRRNLFSRLGVKAQQHPLTDLVDGVSPGPARWWVGGWVGRGPEGQTRVPQGLGRGGGVLLRVGPLWPLGCGTPPALALPHTPSCPGPGRAGGGAVGPGSLQTPPPFIMEFGEAGGCLLPGTRCRGPLSPLPILSRSWDMAWVGPGQRTRLGPLP